MDIKTEITNIVKKITEDKELLAKFKSDPKGAVTSLLSETVGSDAVNAIVEGVKAKINLDSAGDIVSKLSSGDAGDLAGKAKDMLGGILGKK